MAGIRAEAGGRERMEMNRMKFTVLSQGKEIPLELEYEKVFAIGYAGRNMEKTMEHIRELERELGVLAPRRIPTIFQCGTYLLTQERELACVGKKTCGEAEYVIVLDHGKIYIGLGSDHTDRELEAVSVPKAKQICAKPICSCLWDYEEIREHWDEIFLRSWQTVAGKEFLYQEGTLRDILPVEAILKEIRERVGDPGNWVIFSGTVPVRDGFRFGSRFRYEMEDTVLGRKLSAEYNLEVISEEER